MNVRSKLLLCLLCIIMFLPMVAMSTLAVDIPLREISYSDINTKVIIENQAVGITPQLVDEIAHEHPNTTITFTNYVEAKPEIVPHIVFGITITSKTTTSANYIDKDVFVISVAKGSQKSLTETWKQSLAAEVTHSDANLGLGLNSTITKEYSKTEVFSGPPENSVYNSREFRIRFYADKGTYTGYYETDMGRGTNVSGTFKNPLRYAEYIIDRNIT